MATNRLAPVAAAAALAVSAVPASAATTVAPPGNSGLSQYMEVVPTAKGGRPTVQLGSPNAGSAISGNTAGALAGRGATGGLAARFARATAPRHGAPASVVGGRPSGPTAVLNTIAGSGIGVWLPLALGLITIAVAAVAVARRRGQTTT